MYILLRQLDHDNPIGIATEHPTLDAARAAKREWEAATGRRGQIVLGDCKEDLTPAQRQQYCLETR